MTALVDSPPRTAASKATVGIIGAGPGGLSAAVLLAASGLKVRVYEAAPRIGGRCARIEAGPFRFDMGPTFFMMPHVLEEVFAAAGRRLTDYVTLHRLDPMYRLVIGNQGAQPTIIDATQDVQEMSRRIAAIDPLDGEAFPRFIQHNRDKLRFSEPLLRSPMRSPLDLFSASSWRSTLRIAPLLNPHLSVYQLLSRFFRHPAVRLAVGFQSKYLGMSPFDCPSLFTILPFIEYEYGVWHPVGGCAAIMHALADLARELGVEVVTGAPVSQIEFADGAISNAPRATGVRLQSGESHGHEHLVINADATWALKNLVPQSVRARTASAYADRSIDAKRYSCSTYMLYLGVDGEVELPHHTIYISARYRDNIAEIADTGTLSEDPSAYVCNPSRLDPSMAPKGSSSLYVLVPTPNLKGNVNWPAERAKMRERALDQLEQRFGIRGIRSRIRHEVELTPRDWQAQNINFGATFNLSHNLGQLLHLRPQNRLKGFENLYLVGGGTHPGSGLPTIFLSAQVSSRLLCNQAGVRYAGDSIERSATTASAHRGNAAEHEHGRGRRHDVDRNSVNTHVEEVHVVNFREPQAQCLSRVCTEERGEVE